MSYSVIFKREGAEEFEKSLTLSLAAINAIDTKICDIEFVDGIKFTGDIWRFYNNDIVKVSIVRDDRIIRFDIKVISSIDDEEYGNDITIDIDCDQIYSVIHTPYMKYKEEN